MFVQLRPAAAAAKRHAIGIDIGGTKIAAGVVAEAGTIIRALTIPTPQRQDQIVAAIAAAVADLQRAHPDVAAVGVGAAGMVDWPSGHIRWAPNNACHDLPLQRLLAARSGCPRWWRTMPMRRRGLRPRLARGQGSATSSR